MVAAQDYHYGQVSDPDGWTNVRDKPSLSASVVERVDSGDYVIIVRQQGEFYDCLLLFMKPDKPDIFGYIHKSRVKKLGAALGAGIVNDPDGWSYLRSGPATDKPALGKLWPKDGFFVVLVKAGSDWYKILTRKGQRGYLHQSRLEWVIPRN